MGGHHPRANADAPEPCLIGIDIKLEATAVIWILVRRWGAFAFWWYLVLMTSLRLRHTMGIGTLTHIILILQRPLALPPRLRLEQVEL